MSNKGYNFEKETVEKLKSKFGDKNAFRVYGSGRNKLSKNLSDDVELEGDVILTLPNSQMKFQIECKHYKDSSGKKGKERSVRVQKGWLDQNLEEAQRKNALSIVGIKFKYTSDNAVHYIMPENNFFTLLEFLEFKSGEGNKEILQSLKGISTEELMAELQCRVKEKKELQD